MTKSKKIIMAKRINHIINFKLINKGDKMTMQEIKKQINMAKIHSSCTKKAKKNIVTNEKLMAGFGGTYTQAEINMLEDLHPGVFKCLNEKPIKQSNVNIIDTLDFLTIYNRVVQEDNYFMA